MVVILSADDGRMTWENFQNKKGQVPVSFPWSSRCRLHLLGQKLDDILVTFDITMLGVLAILAVCQQTGCCKREIAALKGVEQVRIPQLRLCPVHPEVASR